MLTLFVFVIIPSLDASVSSWIQVENTVNLKRYSSCKPWLVSESVSLATGMGNGHFLKSSATNAMLAKCRPIQVEISLKRFQVEIWNTFCDELRCHRISTSNFASRLQHVLWLPHVIQFEIKLKVYSFGKISFGHSFSNVEIWIQLSQQVQISFRILFQVDFE